jgi:hypothetical protein
MADLPAVKVGDDWEARRVPGHAVLGGLGLVDERDGFRDLLAGGRGG